MATQSWRPLKTLSQGTIGCEIMQPTGSPGFGLTEDSRTSHIAYKQSSVKLSQFSMEGLVWQDSRTTDSRCKFQWWGVKYSVKQSLWLLTGIVCTHVIQDWQLKLGLAYLRTIDFWLGLFVLWQTKPWLPVQQWRLGLIEDSRTTDPGCIFVGILMS